MPSYFLPSPKQGGSKGESLIVYTKQDKEITFTSVLCFSIDLKPGFGFDGQLAGEAGTVRSVMFLIAALLPAVAYGNMPYVTDVMVTDVTTKSFSVIWASSEASYPGLNVYDDAEGTIPTSDAVITLQPVESDNNGIGMVAEDNGVLKVRVTGLEPDRLSALAEAMGDCLLTIVHCSV